MASYSSSIIFWIAKYLGSNNSEINHIIFNLNLSQCNIACNSSTIILRFFLDSFFFDYNYFFVQSMHIHLYQSDCYEIKTSNIVRKICVILNVCKDKSKDLFWHMQEDINKYRNKNLSCFRYTQEDINKYRKKYRFFDRCMLKEINKYRNKELSQKTADSWMLLPFKNAIMDDK